MWKINFSRTAFSHRELLAQSQNIINDCHFRQHRCQNVKFRRTSGVWCRSQNLADFKEGYQLDGPGSVVDIATSYRLDGPGIEWRWKRDFPHLSRPALGAHPASCTMGTGSFPGGKERPGREADLSPPSSAVAMKEKSYASTPPMGRTACTETQCLYKGDLYFTNLMMVNRSDVLAASHEYTYRSEDLLTSTECKNVKHVP